PTEIDSGQRAEGIVAGSVEIIHAPPGRSRLDGKLGRLAVDQLVAEPSRYRIPGIEALKAVAFVLRERIAEEVFPYLIARLICDQKLFARSAAVAPLVVGSSPEAMSPVDAGSVERERQGDPSVAAVA